MRVRLAAACFVAAAAAAGAAAQGHRPVRAAFDSGRAFEDIRQLVAIGPRVAGSPGGEAARRYISRELDKAGLSATLQPFTADTPLGPRKMANVIARIPGASSRRIVIGGHYDTKLFRDFMFVGANDAGSSTAMLLELARALKGRRGPFTIELVFFDGEEAFVEWSGQDHTYGSRAYVKQAKEDGSLANIRAMVLVDMVADRDLDIRRDSNSTPWLTDIIWKSAARLGHGGVFLNESEAIEDDHRSFLEAGIPAVDVIDLDYRAWHTAADTLDNISARSLQIVGDVLLDALPGIEAAVRTRPPVEK